MWYSPQVFSGRAGMFQKEGGWGGGYVSDFVFDSLYVWVLNPLHLVGLSILI